MEPASVSLAGHLHAAAALTERGANGGLRNIVSWRVKNLEADGGPASYCLNFTAKQSAQNSPGTSRKWFFFVLGLDYSLWVFLSVLLFSWAFSHVEEEVSTIHL